MMMMYFPSKCSSSLIFYAEDGGYDSCTEYIKEYCEERGRPFGSYTVSPHLPDGHKSMRKIISFVASLLFILFIIAFYFIYYCFLLLFVVVLSSLLLLLSSFCCCCFLLLLFVAFFFCWRRRWLLRATLSPLFPSIILPSFHQVYKQVQHQQTRPFLRESD